MKKCKNCGVRFEPRFNTLEKFCWETECKTIEALQKLEQLKEMEVRNWNQRKKELKKANKNASDYRNDLQKVFNTWVRLRDADKGCISCGAALNTKFDAGHYFSVGSYPNLRFHCDNVHGQCVECNQHKRGNLIEYRVGLIRRIGQEKVDNLYELRKVPQKLSTAEMLDFIGYYKNLIKILRSE